MTPINCFLSTLKVHIHRNKIINTENIYIKIIFSATFLILIKKNTTKSLVYSHKYILKHILANMYL